MIPFAIAGVQMPIPALQDNTSAVVAAVGRRRCTLPVGADGGVQRARVLRAVAQQPRDSTWSRGKCVAGGSA